MRAARAGKALLLEKPLALDLASAEAMADAVEATGVATQMVLTWRYRPEVRELLAAAARTRPLGGRGHFLTGGFLGGMFATPWRLEQGPLLRPRTPRDRPPRRRARHVVRIRAHGDPHRWVGLLLDHEGGATSEASLTAYSPIEPARAGVEIHTADGVLEVDTVACRRRPPPRSSMSS